MTAWCSSTTSVRKVRARSSEKLRVLTFGTALASVDASEGEIVVIPSSPSNWTTSAPFSCCRRHYPSSSMQNRHIPRSLGCLIETLSRTSEQSLLGRLPFLHSPFDRQAPKFRFEQSVRRPSAFDNWGMCDAYF